MIRVNGVAPGGATPRGFQCGREPVRLERTPMGEGWGGRWRTVLFLIDGPRAITGTVLTVDGGFSARW